MLTGENGILTQAQNAKDKTEQAEKEEMSDLDSMESLINEYAGGVNIPQVTDENPGKLEQENANTFVINSIEDLVVFSHNVRSGDKYEGQTVKLGVNLDFKSDKSYVDPDRTDYGIYGYNGNLKQLLTTGEGFIPIGEQEEGGNNYFYGTFDGNNNVICSLYENINTKEKAFASFFSLSYGEIKNLGLINVDITAISQGENSASVGGITRISYNKIINCYVTGNIKTEGGSWQPVGGICGALYSNEGSIENCYNLANIECKNNQKKQGNSNISCGGILGQSGRGGFINKCTNKGKINIDGGINDINLGGICGNFALGKNIKNSYNVAKIECTSNGFATATEGGIVGSVGYNGQEFFIENCYNTGEIINNTNNSAIGGIVGEQWKNTSISNVYNIGRIVTSTEGNLLAGGITGEAPSGIGNMQNAYNIGMIEIQNTNNNMKIGSIIGNLEQVLLNNCLYLKGTYSVGVGEGSSTGVTELQDISEFPSVLQVVNGEGAFKEDMNNINEGYPILEWQ